VDAATLLELELVVKPRDKAELEVVFPLTRLPPNKFAFMDWAPIDDFK
jgi:hypothetical protein